MNIENLKYVVSAKENEPAIIRFFDSVNEYSARQFVDEFLFLQDCIKPSKIVVLINSEGGSVLYGMSMFSAIQSSPIEVDCIVEGIAASMGSVIWAAGDNLFMHDYSLLMIHNPFSHCGNDESMSDMINAFKSQLSTIYQKRFGLTKDEVQKIMDGEGDADGTFLTAKDAVKRGILDKSHVIKTTKAVRDSVQNKIDGVADAASIKDIMASIVKDFDENKLIEDVLAIHKQNEQTIQDQNKVMDSKLFETVAAQLGFTADAGVTAVSARISELIKKESELKDAQAKIASLEGVQSQLDDLKIKMAGKEAEITNANTELEEVKASLKKYQDAEQEAREAEIKATVDAAIEAGKIDESAKETWISMAQNNFEMVKTTLASISGRQKVSEEIANDPANIEAAKETLKTVQDKVDEAVAKVVGNFEFKKF